MQAVSCSHGLGGLDGSWRCGVRRRAWWAVKVVQARLGHVTADVYGHLFSRDDDAAELQAAERAFLAI